MEEKKLVVCKALEKLNETVVDALNGSYEVSFTDGDDKYTLAYCTNINSSDYEVMKNGKTLYSWYHEEVNYTTDQIRFNSSVGSVYNCEIIGDQVVKKYAFINRGIEVHKDYVQWKNGNNIIKYNIKDLIEFVNGIDERETLTSDLDKIEAFRQYLAYKKYEQQLNIEIDALEALIRKKLIKTYKKTVNKK